MLIPQGTPSNLYKALTSGFHFAGHGCQLASCIHAQAMVIVATEQLLTWIDLRKLVLAVDIDHDRPMGRVEGVASFTAEFHGAAGGSSSGVDDGLRAAELVGCPRRAGAEL